MFRVKGQCISMKFSLRWWEMLNFESNGIYNLRIRRQNTSKNINHKEFIILV